MLFVLAAAACGKSPAPVSAAANTSPANTPATVAANETATAPPAVSSAPIATDAEAPAAVSSATASPPPAGRSDMRLVPAGPFTMGADRGGQEDEHPAHVVTLAPFWLDTTEVSNAKWDECVAANACRAKSAAVRSEHPDFNGPNQPVSGVAWEDARGYCAWRGKRLPREAEFEKAVRDSDDRRFAWGSDPPSHDKTVFGGGHPEDVGTHPAGRGPYGHDDLAGNVWEWMQDEYDPYAYRRATAGEGIPGTCGEILAALGELRRSHKEGFTGSNPIPDECEHSIRGGAYNYDPDGLRGANRVHHPGKYRIPMLGLRCAADASIGADGGGDE